MIEVFKTNVRDRDHANYLVDQVHAYFTGYTVNFDLDDCDKIFRVKSNKGSVHNDELIDFLKELDCTAEVLPEDKILRWATTFTHACL